jgi:glycerol-3-phosphate acyltransferase PlsY
VVVALVAMSALLVWRHSENINRLIQGKESRLGSKK